MYTYIYMYVDMYIYLYIYIYICEAWRRVEGFLYVSHILPALGSSVLAALSPHNPPPPHVCCSVLRCVAEYCSVLRCVDFSFDLHFLFGGFVCSLKQMNTFNKH